MARIVKKKTYQVAPKKKKVAPKKKAKARNGSLAGGGIPMPVKKKKY